MSILFPTNDKFDNLFLALAESIKDMVNLVHEFGDNFEDFEKYAQKANIIENQADSSTHKILTELQTAFITPYDREDLHALVIQLDDVVDKLEELIRGFYMYNITDKKKCVTEFADLYSEAADHLITLIKGCFGKKKNNQMNISKTIIAIHTIESHGDTLYMKNIRELFTHEKDPIELLKWRVAIEHMESALDCFERTANTVESLKLKAN